MKPRTTIKRHLGPATEAAALREGRYLTDESSLFRCLAVERPDDPDATVLLEDCLTLDVIILPLSEVSEASLRLVR